MTQAVSTKLVDIQERIQLRKRLLARFLANRFTSNAMIDCMRNKIHELEVDEAEELLRLEDYAERTKNQ